MFDAVTGALISSAPHLEGLSPDLLREELTAAYVEIASARLALGGEGSLPSGSLTRLIGKMSKLANAFEARIVLDLDRERRRSIAFVAASARQFLALAARITKRQAAEFDLEEDAISADIAATLLFLIAERPSDAAEAAQYIRADSNSEGVRAVLVTALVQLARGQLTETIQIEVGTYSARQSSAFVQAADLLYRELLRGVVLLAHDLLGQTFEDSTRSAADVFEQVRVLSLSVEPDPVLPTPVSLSVVSILAGPHHLAGLLLRVSDSLRASAVVKTPPPSGADPVDWRRWVRREASLRPYLWENHLRAIQTGFLNCGQSLVMTSPTGSGKSTLSALKIISTILSGRKVLYLAPTHALVSQVERDINTKVIGFGKAESLDESAIEEILPSLPTVAVVTPERCFALLTFAPKLFQQVGLLVFDECHLLGVGETGDPRALARIDRRGIDAMLCLLLFMQVNSGADLLLLSAVVSNGPEAAQWLQQLMQRPVHAFDDRWKPTRQLRACVTYDRKDLQAAARAAGRNGRDDKIEATPYGLFSLVSGWNPGAPEKLLIRPFASSPIALGVSRGLTGRIKLTANRFEVARAIADRFERAGLKVLIFCESIPNCVSLCAKLNKGVRSRTGNLDTEQNEWRENAIKELGTVSELYDAGPFRAAVHHGDLLKEERQLAESVFRDRDSGVNILVATSTLAQGLNLPCEVVILAGTDRSDEGSGRRVRKPLLAHEILNALGRAGRAGQSGTGLAVVIPADLIPCDVESMWVASRSELKVVFSEGDQCLPLLDPLTTLFDQIEVAGDQSPEAKYLLRRLSVSLGTGADRSDFDDLVRRTFGYHQRRVANQANAEAWLSQSRTTLTAAIRTSAEPPTAPWHEELAAQSGVRREFISLLINSLEGAPLDEVNALVWMEWLIDLLDPTYDDVDSFMRPESVGRVFGRAYERRSDQVDKRKLALYGIRQVLPLWFSGMPLFEVEKKIAYFVAAHEGSVKIKTKPNPKVKRARRFAIRIAPDLAFLCGLLGQVLSKISEDGVLKSPAIVQFLPQLVRKGYGTPYHFALGQGKTGQSRVGAHQEYVRLSPRIHQSASDTWTEVRDKVSVARLEEIYDAL